LTIPTSYLTLLHGITIGLCLSLAVTHLVLVVRSEVAAQRRMFLASTLMAVAAGSAIFFELDKALSGEVADYIAAQWGEVMAVYVMILALLIFVRLYFNARANRLFVSAVIVWTVAHVIQLFFFPASFFAEILELRTFETSWGETYSKLAATPAAPKYIADIGSVLVLIYIARASIQAWKRNERRQALIVGGASAGFMLIAGILVPLDDAGMLRMSMPFGLPFLLIIAALTYQLIDDRIRTNSLRLEIEQLRRASLAGEIAAGLVHELNQPLTSILSNSQAARRFLALEDPDLDEVRAALDDIVDEDKRAAGIIHGFRSLLSRDPAESSVIDINGTIRRVASMLSGDFNTGETRLKLALHPSPLKVSAGEVQIQQVLINLALNALRAMTASSQYDRAVEFRTRLRDDWVEVSVTDSGPGIADEMLPSVFEPFMSGADGLGMGLAICNRIVTSYDGRIWAENVDAGGARLTFTLPTADKQEWA
jgi:signal transduction histidine kinase